MILANIGKNQKQKERSSQMMRQRVEAAWMLAIVGIAATARHADAGLASSHHAAALARHLAAATSATDAAMATSKLAFSATPPPVVPTTWRSTVSITSAGPSASPLGATYIFAQNGVKKRRALRSTTKVG